MALPSTLFRFRIDLSDVDRGVYERLDFRVAMHPSEIPVYLVTRVLAYALNFQDGLEFHPGGLSDPEEPCLRITDPRGGFLLWIEIGSPSAKKLHKAAKIAETVRVYTYKNPQNLLNEIASERVHRADELEVYSLHPKFLEDLAARLERDNEWTLIHTEGALSLDIDGRSLSGELLRHATS